MAIYLLTSKELSMLPDEQIGNFSKAEVLEIVNEMWRNSGKKEQPTIYISELSMVNAFAINTLFNFYKPVNAIYITRMAFTCLHRQELLGILYHEMAHFNKYIYFEARTMNITLYFFMLFPLSLIILVPTFVLKGLFIIGMLIFMGYLWNKVRAVHDLEGHALEYLCDLEASKQVGRLAMINALIVICRENIPKEEEARKKIQKKLISKKPLIPVDWAAFDTHIVNGKIEPQEYDKLIHTLVSVENPQLLEGSENDGDSSSHPSLTNRVLFLHRNAPH
jgi:Zn-dependent protease with chaperone function